MEPDLGDWYLNHIEMQKNIQYVQQSVGEIPIMAIVKCNAYGHSMIGSARLMQKAGINRFGVVKVQEAVALRQENIGEMVLNMGPFTPHEAIEIVRHDIRQSFQSILDLNWM